MPGWQGSTRHEELPDDWAEKRRFVGNRDHWRCQWVRRDTGRRCGQPANQCDHRVRPADGGSDDPSNLRMLCEWHHSRKTAREGAQALGDARLKRKQAAMMRHPGVR